MIFFFLKNIKKKKKKKKKKNIDKFNNNVIKIYYNKINFLLKLIFTKV